MKAIWKETVVAESNETVVVEGNHYFPLASVKSEYLQASDTTSVCPWKGTANYYALVVDGDVNQDAAWYYAQPKAAAKEIGGHIAFWRGVQLVE